jgi:hypothetical protein
MARNAKRGRKWVVAAAVFALLTADGDQGQVFFDSRC